jgi:tetratricopeptide (TPR) repeat protein
MPSRLVVYRTTRPARRSWLPFLAFLAGLLLVVAALSAWLMYETIPSVRYHAQTLLGQVRDFVAPHADILPTPEAVAQVAPIFTPPPTPLRAVSPRLDGGAQAAITPTTTVTPTPASPETAQPNASPLESATVAPSATSSSTATPAPTATPIPAQFSLNGITQVYQKFNNCGPASLTEELTYWGWKGTQADAAQVLKPSQDDKNVSPRELYEYLLTQGYDAYIRMGGDIDLLKRFIAAGYPPLVEKGFDVPDKGWMGHYGVISAYDDKLGVFIIQDIYLGPNIKMTYAEFERNWRAFNYIYLIVFPAGKERDAEVVSLLGEMADLDHSYRVALARAQAEAPQLSGQAAAFAWFNVGTSLSYLQDYNGAAAAYDQARKIGLPYRMLWYQFGPYLSYYVMGRYRDVIDLASFAIDSANIPAIEESYYWRGMAEQALGQREPAIADYREALNWHPGFALAKDALAALGVTP